MVHAAVQITVGHQPFIFPKKGIRFYAQQIVLKGAVKHIQL